MNIYLKNILKYIYIRPILGAFNEYLYNRPMMWVFNKYLIWARIKGPNEYLIWAHIKGL